MINFRSYAQIKSTAATRNQDRCYTLTETDDQLLSSISEVLQSNIIVLDKNGYLLELLRAKMSLLEYLFGAGKKEEAEKIVENVLIISEGVRLINIINHCNDEKLVLRIMF